MINKLFERFSKISRERKLEALERHIVMRADFRVLDIGGQLDAGTDQLLERHPEVSRMTVLNFDPQHLARIREVYPAAKTVQGDAAHLPFDDKSFDLVYSNAVIEHVGGLAQQTAMAREVMRVGKRWFITTPNRRYPFEFHTRMPFIGWLPERAFDRASQLMAYNHIQRRYQRGLPVDFRLMTGGEITRLFPDSLIIRQRVTFWPETIIAVGPRAAIAGAH